MTIHESFNELMSSTRYEGVTMRELFIAGFNDCVDPGLALGQLAIYQFNLFIKDMDVLTLCKLTMLEIYAKGWEVGAYVTRRIV